MNEEKKRALIKELSAPWGLDCVNCVHGESYINRDWEGMQGCGWYRVVHEPDGGYWCKNYCVQAESSELKPNYCPQCGAKVVK